MKIYLLLNDKEAVRMILQFRMCLQLTQITNGYNMMPPTGLCADCNAKDYEAVIRWMSK